MNSSRGRCVALFAATLIMTAAEFAPAAQKVLRIRLDGPVAEAPTDMDVFAALAGEETKTHFEWVRLIQQATKDKSIDGIVLIVEQPVMSLAQAEEITRALREFRATGRKIHCYLDWASNLSYALACAADHITLAEHSELFIVGLNGGMSFYKGMFDKIGVTAQILRCGAYKSAAEPFMRTEPSKESAENLNWLLDGLYASWLDMMTEGRGLERPDVEDAVDHAPLAAEDAQQRKLVDDVSSWVAFKQLIHKEYGKDVKVLKRLKKDDELQFDPNNPFAIFDLFSKFIQKADEPKRDGIGIVYIEGSIIVGENEPNMLGSGPMAGSTTIRDAFEDARLNDNVKAVVVRVNSPGGSALASDIMWKAAVRCAQEKPLFVSMGGVAGSGGYYVAVPGDQIFAEESTITGSIGVLGGKLVWRELWEDKIGITTTEFPRGRNADLMSMNKPWNEREKQFMQNYLDTIYTQFKERIMTSRGNRIEGDLDQLAGGRVYTGAQARERGLVDRIGGLSDALALAAQKANLGDDYEVYLYPEKKDPFEEMFAQILNQDREDEFEIAARVSLLNDPLLRAVLPLVKHLDPQRAGTILRDMRNLAILNREHVGCFMTCVPTIR